MNLRIVALIRLSSLLTLIATAQLAPATDEPKAKRPAFREVYEPGSRRHIGRSGDDLAALLARSMYSQPSRENADQAAVATMVPTCSSFIANWQSLSETSGYRLDVSTTRSFSTYVNGYQDLDVGKATSRIVTGLTPGTKYFYRVRAYNAGGASSNSAVMSATTAAGSGLVINATFDSSILNNPNSAAIEAMINQAITIFESLFSDPITISILFRYATTGPHGTLLGSGTLAVSDFGTSAIPWNTYITALQADAKTSNDGAANASLPANPLSANIVPSTAGGRAIGLDTPPMMFANGAVGTGGPYDGIVTLNSAVPFQFSRPTTANNYDALQSTEHEIDEVLGLGSYINSGSTDLRPQDLFSWSSPGTRNITLSGSRYFSIDNGNTDIVGFNQDPNGDFGDWLSESCPQSTPYVQNAFGCAGQSSDVTATSPEGIDLDVIGYDLVSLPDGGSPGNNTAEGDGALFNLTSGTFNTANGSFALYFNTSGSNNTAEGTGALVNNTSGNNNTVNGVNALYFNTTGGENTANGVAALQNSTTANYNTADGFRALFSNTTGLYNTAEGAQALLSNTTGGANTAEGTNALFSNTTGSNNTANGFGALLSNTTGSANTATGLEALQANRTASFNTADGFNALFSNRTGKNNVAVGFMAGGGLTTGDNNIDIGANVLGAAGEANTIRIGTEGTQTATFIAGISGATVASGATVIVGSNGHLGTVVSSERFKDQIKPMDKASEAVLALKPVTFRYKHELDPEGVSQFGLVAEDVEKVNPDLVTRDQKGQVYSVRYEAVNAMLLNEFLKEHRRVEEQDRKVKQLEAALEAVNKHLKEQDAKIQKMALNRTRANLHCK